MKKTTMAQSDNNLFALEKQLCFYSRYTIYTTAKLSLIQMIITAILYNIDSLILAGRTFAVDKEMKYDFIELRKKRTAIYYGSISRRRIWYFPETLISVVRCHCLLLYIQYKDKEHLYFFDINEDNGYNGVL